MIDWEAINGLESSLARVTSPSSIAEEVKSKIDKNHTFFEIGLTIIEADELTNCPLCEQSISSGDPKSVIDTYIQYFADEEEQHKKQLRAYYSSLKNIAEALEKITTNTLKQKNDFDNLKVFIPSKSTVEIIVTEKEVEDLKKAATSIQAVIEEKAKRLGELMDLPKQDLERLTKKLNKVLKENNDHVNSLISSIEKSDEERRELQREACKIFFNEFVISNWAEIETCLLYTSDAADE